MARHPRVASPALHAAITSVQPAQQAVDTSCLFDRTYAETTLSPIDRYIENTNSLNLLYLPTGSLTKEMGPLILLGYMSAVESFFRALLRGLINVDEYARRLAEPQNVTYGAALNHQRDVLAEALMEGYSFSASDKVREGIKVFAGIKGGYPSYINVVLDDFKRICEMRHCCVHRFGKLGAKNAIRLGLDAHSAILEKPLLLSAASLEDIAERLRNFCKTMNNYIFKEVMERTVKNRSDDGTEPLYSVDWRWHYGKDRRRFERYYSLFATSKDATPSPPPRDVYESLKTFAAMQRSRSKA